jgi:hypothetical protein
MRSGYETFGDEISKYGQVVGYFNEATDAYTTSVTAPNSQGFVSVETVAVVYTIEPLVYHIFLPLASTH